MGTIAISGSASGIGAATRKMLEADGHTVIGLDLRDAEVTADLSTHEGRDTAVAAVLDACDGVLDGLVPRFPEHPRERLIECVRRFYRLWVRNQWKRERLAPSFHLDDENLDPKTWCRYPILGGDWSEELDALV